MDALTPQVETLNGTDIAWLECGAGPLVICQHGFPDTAWSFVPVLHHLAAAGFHAVAPFLRGYAPSGLSADGDYRLPVMAGDLLALIDHFGATRAHVVGHDWGDVIAQYAAISAPHRFGRMVLAAVPHLRRFTLRPSLKQVGRSHYILRFQWPGWAERAIPADNFRWLRGLIHDWSPDWRPSEADLAPLLATLGDPDRLRATLAYYRALPLNLANRDIRRTAFAPIPVPTRMLYGRDDGCIGPEMFSGQDALFPLGLDLCEMPNGHFMQCEAPAAFARHVIDWLRQ
jgi:pimeloyl-ACP methyl ester carboxylesterase